MSWCGGALRSADPRPATSWSVTSVLQTDEFRYNWVAFVNNMYLGYVDASSGAVVSQFGALQSSNDHLATEVSVLGGADYYAATGSTADGFVLNLYNDVLRRTPSSSEPSYWAGQITSGTRTRSWVANYFIRTSEAAGHRVGSATASSCVTTTFVDTSSAQAGSYCIILDRVADTSGRSYWIGQLTGTAQLPVLWAALAGSVEYFNNAQ